MGQIITLNSLVLALRLYVCHVCFISAFVLGFTSVLLCLDFTQQNGPYRHVFFWLEFKEILEICEVKRQSWFAWVAFLLWPRLAQHPQILAGKRG